MNIFIYGSKSFKKEIQSVLDHANIKFKLDEDSVIKDIDSLSELKTTIENSPHDIYLIEEEKIIKKNSLNSKVKFLTPKDGIDEDFLLEHSIPDITIDSLDDLPKYIIKKHDEYLEERENLDVQNEIIEIVDDAYSSEDIIDDELSSLLAKDESENNEDETIDDFSNDGFDDYKFEENIDSSNENLDISNKDDDEVQIVDFEKELENIDDLMDEEENDLDLSKIEDDLNLDDLMDNETISEVDDDLEKLDSLIEEDNDKDESSLEENSVSANEEDLDSLLADLDIGTKDYENIETLSFDENKEDEDDSFDLDLPDLDALDELIESNGLDTQSEDEPNFEELENKLDEISLNETEVEENDDKIDELNLFEETNNISQGQEEIKGEEMNDDFSQLDSITEAELLEALGDTSIPSASKPVTSINKTQSPSIETNNSVEISSNNIEDLTKLFTQLLNNKTLEITIKIKD